MAAPFAILETLVSAEVDAMYGEGTRIHPMAAGRVSRIADGAREAFNAVGVVDFNPILAKPQDMGQYDGYQPTVAADRIHVSYSEPAIAGGDVRQDDEIELLSAHRNGQRLRITRIDPDGLGRRVCVCVPA